MGPAGCAARRAWALRGLGAGFRAAAPGAGGGARLRPPAGPAPGPLRPAPARVCARGLLGGPGPGARTEWAAAAAAAAEAAGAGPREPDAADPAASKFDIDMLVSLLRQENARDICVIRVPPEMKYADYFVVGSGASPRHLHAVAAYVVKTYKFLKSKNEPHVRIEGKDTDDWLCVDFGRMVVHLMLPETREMYELEKLWTLRSYDDQLAQIAPETLPEDFILGIEDDTSSLTPMEFKCE